MNYPAASSGVSDDSGLKFFAASGEEFKPLRLKEDTMIRQKITRREE
jgi:hypothetical protein